MEIRHFSSATRRAVAVAVPIAPWGSPPWRCASQPPPWHAAGSPPRAIRRINEWIMMDHVWKIY